MSQPALLEKAPSLKLINLKNILFTTDFSPSSLAALPYASVVARRYGATVFLGHAVQPNPYPLISGEAVAFMDELVQGAHRELAGLAECELLKGIEHKTLLGHGEIALVLDKFIKQHDIDLVITGTHGRLGFRRFFLGSVAEEIFRTSACPVLTVGPRVSSQPREKFSLHQVLYATSLAEESAPATNYALSFALEYEARLTVMHVMNNPAQGPEWRLAKNCYDRMEAQIPPEVKPWCKVDCHVAAGDPADMILKTASELKSDLIVLGVKRASALSTHRMGNLAYRVVTEAACPVLTIREASFQAGGERLN
ncbi:MAG TPA: universal stress protein [Terriglobia bacterium]|nr:universal stress protein [Terriglobia bacterium]